MKRKNIYVVMFDSLYVWDNPIDAISFYQKAYYNLDHENKNEYAAVVLDLMAGQNLINKNDISICDSIVDFQNFHSRRVGTRVKTGENTKIEDAILLWENKISQIVKESNLIGVNLEEVAPFRNFNKEDYLNYFKELFKDDSNIERVSIASENEFGGYKVVINDSAYSIGGMTDLNDIYKIINDVESKKYKRVKIFGTWETDYDDLRCNAILSVNGIEKANIIASYDEEDIRNSIGNKDSIMNDDFIEKGFKTLILDDFDDYLKLPKITECSELLQEIYDNVCSSDASMCHISDEDWEEDYSERYNEQDLKKLEKEIGKYNLQDIIDFSDGGYKIVGYGNLETVFNDNRNLEKSDNQLETEDNKIININELKSLIAPNDWEKAAQVLDKRHITELEELNEKNNNFEI